MYGHRFPVTDILPAMNRLGMKNLQGLCMSVAMVRLLGKQLRSLRIQNLWRHNFACGFIAETLAMGTGIDQGTAFSCGLMHDVGRMALCVLHPDKYELLLEVHQGSPSSILQVEREMFGFSHCEAGHELVRSWSLPLPFDQVALMHHGQIGSGGLWTLVDLIGMSCKMADSAGFAAFPGCEIVPYADLLQGLPNMAMGNLYPDVESLASEIQGNIALMRIF
jgi:putative nucleotidyltransferase with HDIG domain